MFGEEADVTTDERDPQGSEPTPPKHNPQDYEQRQGESLTHWFERLKQMGNPPVSIKAVPRKE